VRSLTMPYGKFSVRCFAIAHVLNLSASKHGNHFVDIIL